MIGVADQRPAFAARLPVEVADFAHAMYGCDHRAALDTLPDRGGLAQQTEIMLLGLAAAFEQVGAALDDHQQRVIGAVHQQVAAAVAFAVGQRAGTAVVVGRAAAPVGIEQAGGVVGVFVACARAGLARDGAEAAIRADDEVGGQGDGGGVLSSGFWVLGWVHSARFTVRGAEGGFWVLG